MSGLKIGVVAEDPTDCDAISVLVRRIGAEVGDVRIGINKYSGKGCSKLRKKLEPWMRSMVKEGCSAAVIVHDLDRNPDNGELNDLGALRALLERTAVPAGFYRLICIPVEELEAWFWSDPALVSEVGRGTGKHSESPHLIRKPKEALIRLSIGSNRRPRYSTNDNASLAEKLDLVLCAKRCRAFRELSDFVRGLVEAVAPAPASPGGHPAAP